MNEVYFAWRAGRPTPLDDALNAMLDLWQALDDGDELTGEWAHHAAPARHR